MNVMLDFVTLRVTKESTQVLLLRRNMEDRPHYGEFALVGGMIYEESREGGSARDESYADAKSRIVRTKLGVTPSLMNEVFTDGSANRDIDGWSLVVAHYAFLNPDLSEAVSRNPDYKWVELNDIINDKIKLPFDHNDTVRKVAEHIKNMFGYTTGALYALPHKFTIADIVRVYAQLGIEVPRQSIRKRLIDGGYIREIEGDFAKQKGKPTPFYTINEDSMSFFDRVIGKLIG